MSEVSQDFAEGQATYWGLTLTAEIFFFILPMGFSEPHWPRIQMSLYQDPQQF